MARLSLWLASLLCAAVLGAPAHAAGGPTPEDPGGRTLAPAVRFVGQPVVAVTLERNGRTVDDQSVRDLVVTPLGAPLSLEQVRESVFHLYSLGEFHDIRVDAAPRDGGVALRYILVPRRMVREVVFHGDLGVRERRLREALTERYGPVPPELRLDEAARVLESAYHDWGYLAARVSARLVDAAASDQATLVFDVVPGPRARIREIRLAGDSTVTRDLLLARLDIRSGQPYDRSAIERRLRAYADGLRARRHYQAAVAHETDVHDEGRLVDVILTVDQGPRVEVRFEGDPVPSDRREALVPIAREGSSDEDLLEDSARRIAAYLQSLGYWKATAGFERRRAGEDLVIIFRVARGRQYRVGRLDVTGNETMPLASLMPLVRTQVGTPFVESLFAADAAAVEAHYRRQGYAEALVEPVADEIDPAGSSEGAARVALQMAITEGPRTLIESIEFDGNHSIPGAALAARVASAAGEPFDRRRLAIDRDAVLNEYLSRGYQEARVDVAVAFDESRARAAVTFRIHEGPQILVDHIIIVGNARTRGSVIRRELALVPGAPLSPEAVIESQRRLSALGLFRRIRISELAPHAGNRRDVLVALEEAPATTIGYGGGLEAGQRLRRGSDDRAAATERLEFAPRGFFEIGRRNLWGKNRSIDLFTRVSLRPRQDPEHPDQDGFGFNEYRLVGTYREPRLFGSEADLFVTTFLDQSIRSSFNLRTRGVLAEVRRPVAERASLSGRYSYNRNRLFDEQIEPEDRLLVDRLFPQVSLSTFAASLFRDTRDDPLDPDRGTQMSVDAEFAGRRIGSQVGFAKTLLQGFVYRRLPGGRRVVLASGARLGLARGFAREVAGADGAVTIIRDIPGSVRFFAGGDTTVRGFALDRLGDEATIDQTGFPKGGEALVIFNNELRIHVWRDLGAVVFLDAGNVFARAGDLDLGDIRGGAGFGLRYRSPIGPIRVDLGFKLDRREFAGGREPRTALHISIGQAF